MIQSEKKWVNPSHLYKNQNLSNKGITNFIVSEKLVNSFILLNTVSLFLDGFPLIHTLTKGWLGYIDTLCIIYFLLEASLKIKYLGGSYFSNGWNRYDFAVTILSIPSLVVLFLPVSDASWFASASVLRAGRLLRFLRLLKFIPNADHLLRGVSRACKASVGVFLALAILNITLALTATMLFGKISPEHFGDPLKSAYSLLKMFTIEGWYEIPDTVADKYPNLWLSTVLRIYAITTVLIGGILGMGLANAIFIDEMTSDNNERLEKKIDKLQQSVIALERAINETKDTKNGGNQS